MYSNFFYFVIKLILIGKLKIGEKLTFFCYKIFNLIDKEWKFVEEKYKILIVDDEQSILDMLKLQLEFEGYSVYTAGNAAEALDKLSYSPDIVLLDINMDGMNGLDLCVSIRDFISCPIIFLTARVSEQDKINGFMAGGDD